MWNNAIDRSPKSRVLTKLRQTLPHAQATAKLEGDQKVTHAGKRKGGLSLQLAPESAADLGDLDRPLA